LTLEKKDGLQPLNFNFNRMVNAGYVGRNQAEVRHHIEELAKKGIPGPKTTPTLYPVVCRALTIDREIEVYDEETSGEVEFVLLIVDEKEIYVALGSDHTDRHLEESDIPRAKQICPNIMTQKVWLLDDVTDHWDDLIIRSTVLKDGKELTYQEGRLGSIMAPSELMEFVQSKIPGPLKNTIIYSGTLALLTGEFLFSEKFSAELIDEALGRRLELEYTVRQLDFAAVE
jgi:hypothetical protein